MKETLLVFISPSAWLASLKVFNLVDCSWFWVLMPLLMLATLTVILMVFLIPLLDCESEAEYKLEPRDN